MGWAQRASRDRRRRDQFAPGPTGVTLDKVKVLASRMTRAQIEAAAAQQPSALLRAEMLKLMLPLARDRP